MLHTHGFLLLIKLSIISALLPGAWASPSQLSITVPGDYPIQGKDAYVCVVVELPKQPQKLVGVVPLADQSVVHHILLYGCTVPTRQPEAGKAVVWDCLHHGVCGGGGGEIIYGWGRNAPHLQLPDGVGFSVGSGTNMQYIVAQVHFKGTRPANDASGVRLLLQPEPMPLAAGVITFASLFEIPADTASTKVPISCCYQAHQPVTTAAFRVHAHALGRNITMTRPSLTMPDALEVVATNDPQLPQAFYPVPQQRVIWPGDQLTVTCDFDSRGRHRITYAGATSDDEMCNMYMMVYAPHPFIASCSGMGEVMRAADGMPGTLHTEGSWLPDPSQFWQPPAVTDGTKLNVAGPGNNPLGDLTGVAVGGDASLWAIYRGNHPWNYDTFDERFRMRDSSTIPAAVLLQLDADTGKVIRRMGSGLFSMPHMVTLDKDGNIWVVDVGMHVVFKLNRDGKVLLRVGTPMATGQDPSHFCQPTHVAVARNGAFYVADGYCNSRVVMFDASGKYQGEVAIPEMKLQGEWRPPNVIHSVVLDECQGLLYVAAREAKQVYVVDIASRKVANRIDMSLQGNVWSLVMGPYATPLALTWDAGKDAQLVAISEGTERPAIGRAWMLPGLRTTHVHQMALAAAPPQLSGAADRLFALYIASTCCEPLLRYALVPKGMKLPDASKLKAPTAFTTAPPVIASPESFAAAPATAAVPSSSSNPSAKQQPSAVGVISKPALRDVDTARAAAADSHVGQRISGNTEAAVQGDATGSVLRDTARGGLRIVGGSSRSAGQGSRGSGAIRVVAFLAFGAVMAVVVGLVSRRWYGLLTAPPTVSNTAGYHKASIDELLARSAALDSIEDAANSRHASNGSNSSSHQLPASQFTVPALSSAYEQHRRSSQPGSRNAETGNRLCTLTPRPYTVQSRSNYNSSTVAGWYLQCALHAAGGTSMADAGRLRNLLQQAQQLNSELKSLPLDPDTTRAAYPKVFELCRLVNRFKALAASLPSGDGAQEAVRASWMQRASWLQEDTISLAQERVWAADAKELTANLLLLLCAGAEACDKVLREKAEREVALAGAMQQANQLQAQVTALQTIKEQHEAAAQQMLESRTQLAVLQQQLAAGSSIHQQLQQQLADAHATIQRLESEVQQLRKDLQESNDVSEGRVQVIQMLMQRQENDLSARRDLPKLQEDCTAMQLSLQANAAVIEKLIGLNTELMEQHNNTVARAALNSSIPQIVVNGDHTQLSAQDYNHAPGPPVVELEAAAGALSTCKGPPVGGAAMPATPLPAPAAQPSSLADAFAAFLK